MMNELIRTGNKPNKDKEELTRNSFIVADIFITH